VNYSFVVQLTQLLPPTNWKNKVIYQRQLTFVRADTGASCGHWHKEPKSRGKQGGWSMLPA
jgi:hypothetical protein